ncbi:MAG: GntR family transcriptional regulator [Hyphomicrobiales bacterium]
MLDLGIARIEHETMRQRVHAALRERLMSGAFEPGQGLKIAELALACGTSAMPVREALSRLVAERALESLPNRSVRVPTLSASQLRDLRDVRRAIEGLATEMATSRMSRDDLDALAGLLEAQRAADGANRIEDSVQKNWRFHFTIYARSGSEALLPIIEGLWLRFGPYLRRAAALFDGRKGEATEFHALTLAALARGDVAGARRGIEADIGRSFDLLLETGDDQDKRLSSEARPREAMGGSGSREDRKTTRTMKAERRFHRSGVGSRRAAR